MPKRGLIAAAITYTVPESAIISLAKLSQSLTPAFWLAANPDVSAGRERAFRAVGALPLCWPTLSASTEQLFQQCR